MCAAYRLEKGRDLQIYTVPAGQGKSRIIAGLVTALCQNPKSTGKYSAFHVVYNHEELMNMDQEIIKHVCDINEAEVRFSVPKAGEIEVGKKDEVTIIDEFDFIMLDRMLQFSKPVGRNNKVIGLTATAPKDLGPAELTYLTGALKFKFFDSKIPASLGDLVKPAYMSLDNFLADTRIAEMGKIIYCEESTMHEICEQMSNTDVHRNISDLN